MKASTLLGYLIVGALGIAVGRSASSWDATPRPEGVPVAEIRIRAAVCQWRQESPVREYVAVKVDQAFDQTHAMNAVLKDSGGLDAWKNYRAVLFPVE